ncbi:MAG: flagellar M-ring protein FliF, partial [Buchnera aphidicola]|nr:flagellar M-ring protein FliF [Buchnera aphidicola]
SKNTSSSISDKKEKQEKIDSNIHDQNNLEEKTNINQLVNKICNISNQNPRTMALIIRKWMSEKK